MHSWLGDKNVIRIASMPITLVFAGFSFFCNMSCARMWSKNIFHRASGASGKNKFLVLACTPTALVERTAGRQSA